MNQIFIATLAQMTELANHCSESKHLGTTAMVEKTLGVEICEFHTDDGSDPYLIKCDDGSYSKIMMILS